MGHTNLRLVVPNVSSLNLPKRSMLSMGSAPNAVSTEIALSLSPPTMAKRSLGDKLQLLALTHPLALVLVERLIDALLNQP